MPDWNSSQYLKFKQQRTQPAIDLAKRVASGRPQTIVDLGCGPGNSTAVLKDVFPDAHIVGVDNSPNMIEKAKADHPAIRFSLGDASSLKGRYDLIFSNACLQWIPHHETLLPALMGHLNDHGLLAVQIPMNGEEPLFKLIKEVAANPKWGLPAEILEHNTTLKPHQYVDILTDCASSFEIWETKYHHFLPDHTALIEWIKGTRLRPYLNYLDKEQSTAFEHDITEKAKNVYPIMKNGAVMFGFRRLFFTAVK